MKEALAIDESTRDTPLDMELTHKVNLLYGGTRILQHTYEAMVI